MMTLIPRAIVLYNPDVKGIARWVTSPVTLKYFLSLTSSQSGAVERVENESLEDYNRTTHENKMGQAPPRISR